MAVKLDPLHPEPQTREELRRGFKDEARSALKKTWPFFIAVFVLRLLPADASWARDVVTPLVLIPSAFFILYTFGPLLARYQKLRKPVLSRGR